MYDQFYFPTTLFVAYSLLLHFIIIMPVIVSFAIAGSGKTTLAAHLAVLGKFSFVKVRLVLL